MKACKDCKHIYIDFAGYSWCNCSKSLREEVKYNYVDGTSKSNLFRYMCSSFRELDYSGTCGPDAKYFEPKEEEKSMVNNKEPNKFIYFKNNLIYLIEGTLYHPVTWVIIVYIVFIFLIGK